MGEIDDEVIDLLINANQIDLDALSPPSTYDFIRYSRSPLLDPDADFPLFNYENSSTNSNEAFALNFSEPPEEFRNHVEDLIHDTGDLGTDLDEWYQSSAESLAETALEAGKVGKKAQGSIGYVLMSDIDEELSPEEFSQKSDIPEYFLQDSELNSKYYVFEGMLNDKRDLKIASITENETAVAWLVGRTLEKFDIGNKFKQAYNQRVEEYITENYPDSL